jgi:uncharacterized membrane protein YbaN (DUF454 family)
VWNIKKIKQSSNKFVRGLWTAAGTFFLGLGILGFIIPLLPGTPFLLLAAACYLRGSERMHNWLMNHRWFGPYIRNYQEGKGIPLKIKIIAITTLWIMITISALFFAPFLWLQILLFVIAALVTIHIIRFKTLKENAPTKDQGNNKEEP